MIGEKIRSLRETNNMLIREVAAQLQTDTAMLSKMERGERPFKKEDIRLIAQLFNKNEKELLTLWLADRILKNCANEEFVIESLQLALRIAKKKQ